MEPTIFKFILKYSKREQILLLLITAVSMPFTYLTLEVPKVIINDALGGSNVPEQLFGYSLDQISYLFLLCGLYFLLTVSAGGIKYFLNVYRGVVGEKMLRRLRYQLYQRVLRFPLPYFRRVSSGEIIPMITAETQEVGGFIGDAIAVPAFQGGLLATYLLFIFNQEPILGLFAISLYPLQLYLTPKIQKKISKLLRRRIAMVRGLSQRIEETVAGIAEVHGHDTSRFEKAKISNRFGKLFGVRVDIYRKKFQIKFMNNAINKITPVMFYSIGGYFVIQGELSLGALVAVLAAYNDLSGPWSELLKYYQTSADTRVKYDQIINQFHPENMLPETEQETDSEKKIVLEGALVASNLVYTTTDGSTTVNGASFSVSLGNHVALAGADSAAKSALAALIVRLLEPDTGKLEVAGVNLNSLSRSFVGRHFAYVDTDNFVFRGSVRDNLYYGLKHFPIGRTETHSVDSQEQKSLMLQARQAGGSEDDSDADWINYNAAGVRDQAGLEKKAMEVLKVVELEDDIFRLGLSSTLDPGEQSLLIDAVLEARSKFHRATEGEVLRQLVERFDENNYNTNASVGENLFFGTFQKDGLEKDEGAAKSYLIDVLKQADLFEELRDIGRKVAETMLELFADLPPNHEFFSRFSFIDAEELPEYHVLIERLKSGGMSGLSEEETMKLLTLSFQLTPARHRLGFIDEAIQKKLLRARKLFRHNLPLGLFGKTEFFRFDSYMTGVTIRENIFFGKMVYGVANVREQCEQRLMKVVDGLGFREDINALGLDYNVGNAGGLLSTEQRQKLAIARCVIKRPEILVVNGVTSAMEPVLAQRLQQNIRRLMQGKTLLWSVDRGEDAQGFDSILQVMNGLVLDQPPAADLSPS